MMTAETADRFITTAMAYGAARTSFCWQGGEPTLLGPDFYKRAAETQHRHPAPGRQVENSLQTNGTLLNAEWCRFLSSHRFLVGLSLDGPEDIHNRYRTRADGRGSFGQVMEAAGLMTGHGVDFNILTLLTDANINQPERLYRFFRQQGFNHLQFIPCIENGPDGRLLDYSATAADLGRFYCRLFDLWLEDGFPHVSIRLFEDILIYMLDGVRASCAWGERCDSYLLVEHNGDCYPCDFFVYPEWRLGNILTRDVRDLLNDPLRRRFARMKSERDPACSACPWLDFCQGDCTRHRRTGPADFRGRSMYCQAWQGLLDHITGHPSDIRSLALAARRDHARIQIKKPGRNDPCPCGSGRKYKKCCLNKET